MNKYYKFIQFIKSITYLSFFLTLLEISYNTSLISNSVCPQNDVVDPVYVVGT